jgi:Leucine-rich repeat (LRR) protein
MHFSFKVYSKNWPKMESFMKLFNLSKLALLASLVLTSPAQCGKHLREDDSERNAKRVQTENDLALTEKDLEQALSAAKAIEEARLMIPLINALASAGETIPAEITTWTALVAYCTQLTELIVLYSITDDNLEIITLHCPNLQKLELINCSETTDRGIAAIAQNCPNIRSLCLDKCQITDNSLHMIAQHLGGLTEFDLSRCKDVTDKGFQSLVQNRTALESMRLDSCPQITSIGLEAIAQHCPKLTALSLWNQKSGTSLQTIAQRCKELRFIFIRECPEVSNDDVQALISHCPNLIYARLKNNPNINNEYIQALETLLTNRARSLRHICCEQIASAAQ